MLLNSTRQAKTFKLKEKKEGSRLFSPQQTMKEAVKESDTPNFKKEIGLTSGFH